jgi:DNA-binding MarR family transcriptional regulator
MAKAGIMALMGMNHLTWKRHLEAPLLKEGWTLKQVYLLRKLRESGPLQPSAIADMLYCDRPTASVIIANLEKRGLVSRERSKEDGRRRLISLTASGEKELDRLVLLDPGRPAFDPTACLDDAEKTELERLLQKVREHMKTSSEHGGTDT